MRGTDCRLPVTVTPISAPLLQSSTPPSPVSTNVTLDVATVLGGGGVQVDSNLLEPTVNESFYSKKQKIMMYYI